MFAVFKGHGLYIGAVHVHDKNTLTTFCSQNMTFCHHSGAVTLGDSLYYGLSQLSSLGLLDKTHFCNMA